MDRGSAILVGTMPDTDEKNDEAEAGFTTGRPWLGGNPNYKEITVEVRP